MGEFIGYEDEGDLEAALNDLDQLEGVEEGRFIRQLVPVILEGGHNYAAWAYVCPLGWLPRLEREGLELPTGDWSLYF